MGTYLTRRILLSIPVLFGITVLAFFALSLAPGDPLTSRLGPRSWARMTAADLAAARHALWARSAGARPLHPLAGRDPSRRLRLLRREPQPRRGRPDPAAAAHVAAHECLADRRRDGWCHLRHRGRRPPVQPHRLRPDGVLDVVHRDPRVRRGPGHDLSLRGRAEDPADDRDVHGGQAAGSPRPCRPHDHAGDPAQPRPRRATDALHAGEHARSARQRVRDDSPFRKG